MKLSRAWFELLTVLCHSNELRIIYWKRVEAYNETNSNVRQRFEQQQQQKRTYRDHFSIENWLSISTHCIQIWIEVVTHTYLICTISFILDWVSEWSIWCAFHWCRISLNLAHLLSASKWNVVTFFLFASHSNSLPHTHLSTYHGQLEFIQTH